MVALHRLFFLASRREAAPVNRPFASAMNAPGSIPGSERPAGPVPAPAQAPTRSRAELEGHFEKELAELKKRLAREAVNAVRMLEESLDALWKLDKAAAGEVRRRDDTIDN